MLDRLGERHLVRRDRMPDNRRVVQIGITDAGLALLRELEEPVRACHEQQLGHVPLGQLKTLVDLLRAARRPHEEADSPWR
jgi:DNA-binding MarR family transcriptional regulator